MRWDTLSQLNFLVLIKVNVNILNYKQYTPSKPSRYLETLLELYYQGMDAPLWFAPKTAFSGIESGYSKDERWLGFTDEETKKYCFGCHV